VHSDVGAGMVLTRSLQEAIFLLIFFSKELRLELRWEFEALALLKCLRKRNRVRVWSEIGYQILGQV